MAAALDNLTKAIADLTASVDAVVIKLATPSTPDADVQIAADAVNTQNARIAAALTPPVV